MVSAWATNNGLVLGQKKVEDKSNEITAIPELLKVLSFDVAYPVYFYSLESKNSSFDWIY